MTNSLNFARTRGHYTLHHVRTPSYNLSTVTALTSLTSLLLLTARPHV